jgi:hypothetical protein
MHHTYKARTGDPDHGTVVTIVSDNLHMLKALLT